MTEEQGEAIIDLLIKLNDKLDGIEDKMPKERSFGNKDLNDVYDKIDDVVDAVNDVSRAIG